MRLGWGRAEKSKNAKTRIEIPNDLWGLVVTERPGVVEEPGRFTSSQRTAEVRLRRDLGHGFIEDAVVVHRRRDVDGEMELVVKVRLGPGLVQHRSFRVGKKGRVVEREDMHRYWMRADRFEEDAVSKLDELLEAMELVGEALPSLLTPQERAESEERKRREAAELLKKIQDTLSDPDGLVQFTTYGRAPIFTHAHLGSFRLSRDGTAVLVTRGRSTTDCTGTPMRFGRRVRS